VAAAGEGQRTGDALIVSGGNSEDGLGVIHVDIEEVLTTEAVKSEDEVIAREINADPAALPHHYRSSEVRAIEATFITEAGISRGNEVCAGWRMR
jgi:hypothetical protein